MLSTTHSSAGTSRESASTGPVGPSAGATGPAMTPRDTGRGGGGADTLDEPDDPGAEEESGKPGAGTPEHAPGRAGADAVASGRAGTGAGAPELAAGTAGAAATTGTAGTVAVSATTGARPPASPPTWTAASLTMRMPRVTLSARPSGASGKGIESAKDLHTSTPPHFHLTFCLSGSRETTVAGPIQPDFLPRTSCLYLPFMPMV